MKKIKKLVTWIVALAMGFSLTGVTGLTSVTAFAAGSNYQVVLNDGGATQSFENWDDAMSYLLTEHSGNGEVDLLQDVVVTSSLELSGDITMNLQGYTITSTTSEAAIKVLSGATWLINCTCSNGSGGIKNTGSGPAVEVLGSLVLTAGTYENNSSTSPTIVNSSGVVSFMNWGGNADVCPPTVINNYSSGSCFTNASGVTANIGIFIPGDDGGISGTYKVSNVSGSSDGYVVGTLSMTFDEEDTNYEKPIVILTDAATGTQYTLTADSDYVLGDKIVSDDSVGYMVTPTNRTGELLTYAISSDEDDSDDNDDGGDDNTGEDSSGDESNGYYVSEAGGYIPGTLDVTLDDNNEAVVTVTAEDGTVYTLVEGTDYTVSYDTTEDGIYVVTVTLLDENGEAYGDDYTFEFALEGSSREGYYVSEAGGWIPGTVGVTLDDNNEAIVKLTDADGNVYTLVEGTDYTVSYDITEDGTYFVVVTYIDENGDAYDQDAFPFMLASQGGQGYYVSEAGGWIPGSLDVTLDENNEAVVTVTDADGNVYTLVEGVDYIVSYTEADGLYIVTVTLLDENGDAYATYEFVFDLGANATDIVKTDDSSRVWMYTILAMAAAAAVALVLAGNKKYARK